MFYKSSLIVLDLVLSNCAWAWLLHCPRFCNNHERVRKARDENTPHPVMNLLLYSLLIVGDIDINIWWYWKDRCTMTLCPVRSFGWHAVDRQPPMLSLGPIYVCCVSPPLFALHVFHDRRPIEPIVICTPWMIRGILVKTCSDRFALRRSERFDFQSQHLHQQALCCVGSGAAWLFSLPRLPLLGLTMMMTGVGINQS